MRSAGPLPPWGSEKSTARTERHQMTTGWQDSDCSHCTVIASDIVLSKVRVLDPRIVSLQCP